MIHPVLYHVTSDPCVKEFHCRYCEKPISMLTRLGGEKEFCSKKHREIYLREHSFAALARLMDAEEQEDDRKGGRTKPKSPNSEHAIPLSEHVQMESGHALPPMAPHLPSIPEITGCVGEQRPPSSPRWQPLLNKPAVAKMEEAFVLSGPGAFLYREPAIASAEFSAESDGHCIRAVGFPRITPRMRYLEDCLRRTDRLGFSPP